MGRFTVEPNKIINKKLYILFEGGVNVFTEKDAKDYSQRMLTNYRERLEGLKETSNPSEEIKKDMEKLAANIKTIEETGLEPKLEAHEIGFRKKSYSLKNFIDQNSYDVNSQTMTRVRNVTKYETLLLKVLLMSWTFEKEDPSLKLEFENSLQLNTKILTVDTVRRIMDALPEIIDGVIYLIETGQGLDQEEEKNS